MNLFTDEFLHSPLFNWVLLPLIIFFSRTCDVTLATLRNILIARNVKKIVPLIGFFEVLIWLVAVTTIIKNLNNVLCYIAFAGGYSMGIFVGIKIDARLALGMQVMRIITNNDNTASIMRALNEANLGVTQIDAQGSKGPVKVLLTILKRKNVAQVTELLQHHCPNAFYSIEDIRTVKQGIFPTQNQGGADYIRRIFPLY